MLFTACSEQKKAESVIKEYIKSEINNPNSYEAIEFADLKADITSYKDEPEFEQYKKAKQDSISHYKYYTLYADPKNDTEKELKDMYESLLKKDRIKIDSLKAIVDGLMETNPERVRFYSLLHIWRMENEYGAMRRCRAVFYLTPDLKSVAMTFPDIDSRLIEESKMIGD